MTSWTNLLYHSDCDDAISDLIGNFKERVRLIYIDPPFFSGTDYSLKIKGVSGRDAFREKSTYSDTWDGGLDEYLSYMKQRVIRMYDLLSDDGSLWVHLDWHVSHYVKMMLDDIFGYSNFVNEIVWKRTNSPKTQSKGFGAQHDVILLYAKDASKFEAKVMLRPHDERSLRPYRYEDERGRFRLIEIEAHGIQRTEGRKQFNWRGRTAPYLYKKEILDKWWDDGLIYTSRNQRYSKKQYLSERPGVPVSDLWIDIPPVQGASEEYTGFLTQKPIALLNRIISSASEENDIIADFFAGSGTTALAAESINRRWILSEISSTSLEVIKKRLSNGITYELRKL